ncbi:MAG TPA: hypothetical protein VFN35_17455 [Ktedonobacteraceae bacterium]|nr:hypothetical protein [Ktedonobacteraceae bacterium]
MTQAFFGRNVAPPFSLSEHERPVVDGLQSRRSFRNQPSRGVGGVAIAPAERKGGVMSHRARALRSPARHQILLQFISASQQAGSVQKSLLLDQFIGVRGETRTYALGLLNHPEKRKQAIKRPRSPFYSPQVRQAILLAWKATHGGCAQRLMPFLSESIPLLERCGHLALTEEHRSQRVAMWTTK